MPIKNRFAETHAEITGWRRHLHEHPELMFDLPEQKEERAVYEITAKMVTGKVKPSLFTARKPDKKESA